MVAVMSVGIIHHAQAPSRSAASSALPLREGPSAVEFLSGALPPDVPPEPRLPLEVLHDASRVEGAPAQPGTGPEGEAAASVVGEIDFGRRVTLENTTRNPSGTFGSETRKIYAAFSSQELVTSHVTVVWRDLSRAKILLYQRQPVSVGDAHSFVWIDRSDAWPPGDYSVEIYTGDEAMEPIALGTYSVTRN